MQSYKQLEELEKIGTVVAKHKYIITKKQNLLIVMTFENLLQSLKNLIAILCVDMNVRYKYHMLV